MNRLAVRPGVPVVSAVFSVVGEHHDEPDRLLLLGDDGRHYAHRPPDGPTFPVEPDDGWTLDEEASGNDDALG